MPNPAAIRLPTPAPGADADPRYRGFFTCFARGDYFEAHEVLEPLWLERRRDADGDFYKGLIQIAGAFVHFQKRRLDPAASLLARAEANLAKYPPEHAGLALTALRRQAADWRAQAISGGNPLHSRLASAGADC